ncbi:MAG: flagellar biosynthesis protein FliQ [Candidatus Poribacteria bacterium]|nr:MAG: flagellar biosynthesis protein FliQ [Candidatus Poribacteria bacterium]
MNEQVVIDLVREMIWVTALISAPVLLTALVVGLAISILQAITQIHEMTLTFIPKIVTISLVLVLLLPWVLHTLVSYGVKVLSSMTSYLDIGIRF